MCTCVWGREREGTWWFRGAELDIMSLGLVVNKTAWAETQESSENEKRKVRSRTLENTNVEGL